MLCSSKASSGIVQVLLDLTVKVCPWTIIFPYFRQFIKNTHILMLVTIQAH